MSKNVLELREKYLEVFQYLNELVLVLDEYPPYKIKFINEMPFVKKLGYSNDDLLGKSFHNLINKEDKKIFNKYFKNIEQDDHLNFEVNIKSKREEMVNFNIRFTQIELVPGNRDILVLLDDNSKYKKLEKEYSETQKILTNLNQTIPEIRFWKLFTPKKYEEALQSSYEMLQMVMNNIPQYILWKDKHLGYMGCNKNYARFLGIQNPEYIIGKKDEEVLKDSQKIKELQIIENQILESGKPEYHHIEIWKSGESEDIIFDTNRVPLSDSEGNIVGLLITYQDITASIENRKKIIESEEKYRSLVETSSIGLLEFDVEDNKVSYINPKLLEILGFSDKMVEKHEDILKIINSNRNIEFIKNLQQDDVEFKIVNEKGDIKWLSGKRINQFGSDRKLISYRFWLDDITEKKNYENLITELNINFLNFSTDIHKNILILLRTCHKLLNTELVLYVHKYKDKKDTIYQIYSNTEEKYLVNQEEFSETFLSSKYFEREHDFIQKFQNIQSSKYKKSDPFLKNLNARTTFGKLIFSHEEHNSLICCFFDKKQELSNQEQLVIFLISDALEIEQRRLESTQRLKEQNIRLNEMNKLKSELFSRVSHELKTPLISIKGYNELILTLYEKELNNNIKANMEKIEQGCERLELIIERLIQGSGLEQGKLEIKPKKGNLKDLIKDCVNDITGLVKMRNHKLILNLNDNLITQFDNDMMYDVVSNLISNAAKYTQPGGEILIESQKEDNNIIISIKDNGIGITEEENRVLFKKFGKIERYGQGWDVEIDGTGLGLYISKKIVNLHNGEIWMESKGRNKGSTFYFSLPIS